MASELGQLRIEWYEDIKSTQGTPGHGWHDCFVCGQHQDGSATFLVSVTDNNGYVACLLGDGSQFNYRQYHTCSEECAIDAFSAELKAGNDPSVQRYSKGKHDGA